MPSLILDQEETYDPLTQKIWCFKHVDDIVEGTLLNLGNMVSSYHFKVGQNNMGKILMICKQCLHDGTEPVIDFDLLRSKHIHLLGKVLQF